MPGLAQRNDQFSNAYSVTANGFWSKHRDDVSYNQLQKFWSELSPQARQELLRIDKQTLFEQARKNMYCSRCNGLLLEGFLQIVMYGKSLQQEGVGGHFPCNRSGASKNPNDGGSSLANGCQDEIQDPSVHPWGGLTTTRDGSLTLLDCYLCSKSLKAPQNVFDSARARERERELLYPDACGGGGRGWISQGIASYGRGHGTRETCALHTARLSCDTLVDFWSALGEETRQSLLRMKEEDFIERLMYRFDSKRFCRDCRRNVIREFKELKELKRMRRETRCTSWFCVADTAFDYEVSDDTIQADWRQTFTDTVGIYHHFEWAVGTGEGKSDILEFENVGMNGSVQVNGLDLGGICACYITLRAWKLDGRCTELSVKAHALKGQQCVHCRLVVGDGFVTITRGESIKRFFEHAEEAEEEEDDDSMDKDGNELDGECSRPQKHAKSPELAREFLLDAATVIFKEQVEKAFREGTARQNAHSIFVCLALKLLEQRVHVACKEIITLEKQVKLLEEEEREKREEEERKERRRTKEREKKLRRKERLKGKERDGEKSCSETTVVLDVSNIESPSSIDEEPSNAFSRTNSGDIIQCRPVSPEVQDFPTSNMPNHSYDNLDEELDSMKDGAGSFTVEQSKFSRRRFKFRKEVQVDPPFKWSERRRFAVVSESGDVVNKSEPRYNGDNFETPSRGINVSTNQIRSNPTRSNVRNCSAKFQCSENRMSDRYDLHCSCNQSYEYRAKTDQHVSIIKSGRDAKCASKSDSVFDSSKHFYRGNKYTTVDYGHENYGRPKGKTITGNNPSRESLHSKQVWEPMESKKYPRSNSDSDITLRSSTVKIEELEPENDISSSSGEVIGGSGENNHEGNGLNESRNSSLEMDRGCQNGLLDGAKTLCYQKTANEEAELCHMNSSNVLTMSSTSSNSDNCSSCLSEGDSTTASSSNENTESSSISDSEDASQLSEGREAICSIQNSFSECREVGLEKNENFTGVEAFGSRPSYRVSPDGVESPHAKVEQKHNNERVGSQLQGLLPPVHHNQNMHFPVFQAPPAMGYYHQNPVSWPAASANGLMPFPHPNHYLYAAPIGYGLNGDAPFCVQYGTVHNLGTSLFNPGPLPVYQPIAKANGMICEEKPQFSKLDGACTERIYPAGPLSPKAPPPSEGGCNETSATLPEDSGFSLFHFGGPVAFSAGHKSDPVAPREELAADRVEGDHAHNKKDTTIEEYNLFAASNGLRFSIF